MSRILFEREQPIEEPDPDRADVAFFARSDPAEGWRRSAAERDGLAESAWLAERSVS